MNLIKYKVYLILSAIIGLACVGLYYTITENARLTIENEGLEITLEQTEVAITNLSTTVTDLNNKYAGATHEEFKKFNESDINNTEMSIIVDSFNIGVSKLLNDYSNKTTQFTKGSTKTATP